MKNIRFGIQSRCLKLTYLHLLWAVTLPAQAIVSMEELHFSKGKPGSSAGISLNLSGARGNEDKSSIGFGANYRLTTQESSLNLFTASYNRGETKGVRDTNNAFFHARHIRDVSANKTWEVFAQLERNEFTRLKLRSLAGGGLRKKLYYDDLKQMLLGLGLFYSVEELENTTANEESKTQVTRVNFYNLNRFSWTDNSKIYTTLYAQPVINHWNDYRILAVASLKVAIDANLKLNVSVNVTHDSEPPLGVRKTDTRYLTGFEYTF